mmetsp:Transcript_23812/g.59581  ORF Transcript_23812/g.59581 Transcript_23812/m.59581 type:complete len:97 (+) Transcript_23812:201-491(+)|eukprot:CAMPEP_0177652892 /NCGR_PEP_ID=MMETSP0447-20121125/13411_1 /TAXON_ID=0 /ORGANISM="Stygamoeba regulata, Strain BSH-02190019" /LENGTH=96 /DNA_ID=CAMNT_0019156245 /DNA_START=202 /DNA_END=492 /DNA_ORIENTATION=+
MSIVYPNPRVLSFYKECLRKLRLVRPDQRGYYYYYLRQNVHSHAHEDEPERVNELLERAEADALWILAKFVVRVPKRLSEVIDPTVEYDKTISYLE